jgi:mannose-6-phosphate isomerase-like protein (cupin superfamily)
MPAAIHPSRHGTRRLAARRLFPTWSLVKSWRTVRKYPWVSNRPAAAHTTGLGMRRLALAILTLCLAAAGMTALWPARSSIGAQETPSDTSLLYRETIDDVPSAPALMRLLRISVDPNAGSPMHTHPGPEVGIVQEGMLAVTVRGPATLRRASSTGTPTPVIEPALNSEFLLYPGDQITYPTDTPMAYRNTGSAPAVFLAAVLLPAGDASPPGLTWSDGPPAEDALQGVSSVVLGEAIVESMATGAQELTIERLSLPPGAPIPADQRPLILAVERGSLTLALIEGAAQISSSQNPGRTAEATPATAYLLTPGDALFFPNGMKEASRSTDEADLTLLRMSIGSIDAPPSGTPVGSSEIVVGEPAQPTAAAPEAPSTPASTLTLEPGAIVVVTTDGLRLRESPSTSAPVLVALAAGQQLQIIGPSVEADGFTWWPVLDPNTGFQGYVAADFIQALIQ